MANIKCTGKIECEELYIKGQKLCDYIYPIDIVVVSNKNVSPAEKYGGTWEPLPENYCLWTTNISYEIYDGDEIPPPSGKLPRTIPAGLPNIIGTFAGGDTDEDTGAFRFIQDNSSPVGSGKGKFSNHSFDASRCSTIYGNSDTVQPRSYRIYAWKRVS